MKRRAILTKPESVDGVPVLASPAYKNLSCARPQLTQPAEVTSRRNGRQFHRQRAHSSAAAGTRFPLTQTLGVMASGSAL